MLNPARNRRLRGCTLAELGIVILLLIILGASLVPAIQALRSSTMMPVSSNRVSTHQSNDASSEPSARTLERILPVGLILGVLTAIGIWTKRLLKSFDERAKLAVHQVLSSGLGLTRNELVTAASRVDWLLKYLPDAICDAAAALVVEERLEIVNQRFRMRCKR